MSDESYSGEELNTDTGSYSLDDDDQLQPEDTLIGTGDENGVKDVLDEGYSPPDRARGSLAWGTTAWEQSQDETIEQRIRQEVPDPDSAYGAPDNESGLDDLDEEKVGGDDPDAIRAEDDFVGDSGRRSGRLVAPDEGSGEDDEKDEVAEDVGIDGAGASAEEAAMHIESDATAFAPLGADDEADENEELTEAVADAIRDEDEMNELDSLASADER
ncbi:DUF5709 domain-containing protein [Lapillicoccus sp.]|uniref:DUF5709 domain-containing protein n=1 Tax=Lapillicoccus sp. TaxID=1909287 RepID=UPI00326404DF